MSLKALTYKGFRVAEPEQLPEASVNRLLASGFTRDLGSAASQAKARAVAEAEEAGREVSQAELAQIEREAMETRYAQILSGEVPSGGGARGLSAQERMERTLAEQHVFDMAAAKGAVRPKGAALTAMVEAVLAHATVGASIKARAAAAVAESVNADDLDFDFSEPQEDEGDE